MTAFGLHGLLAGFLGGLLALDRGPVLQAMISRPLPASAALGWALGDVGTGLYVGLVLELFHLGAVTLGASRPDNDTFAATGTTAAAVMMGGPLGGGTPAVWALAILLFAWLGPLGAKAEQWVDRRAGRLEVSARGLLEEGRVREAARRHLWGLWFHFVLFGALTAGCVLAGGLLSLWVDQLPFRLMRGLSFAYPAMAVLAAGVAVRGSHARRPALFAGVAVAVVSTILLFEKGLES